MDAFNTQTRDNLGPILPTSQNVPLKEDLEFLPKATHQSSVKLLRRLAILAAVVSTFGLVSNEISFYHFSSFYNFTCTFTSLASLIISSALIFWSTKTLNHEEGNTDAAPTRRWELFNQGLYTTLLFRAAISIPLIANMLFQGDNTSHHLRAIEATYQDGTYASTENALRSIATVLPFFEVLLSLTFVQAARTVFPYIKEQSSTMTRMVFIGSAVLMASSFGMLYSLRYASDYQDLYGQPFPSWNIGGLVFLGIVSAIVAGLVWTVNHTKWRAPYTVVAGVLAALTLGLALFSTLSYNNSQSIASLYGDMKNLHTWSEQMAATNKDDLRTTGCPSKYLPKSIANDPSFDAFWGPGATTKDGLPTKYLNIACVELLGNQQASYFAEATIYGLLTAVSGLIILIGFLYFNHTQWRDVGERNKKDFRWLAVLGAIFLAFNVAMIMYEAPLPSENAKLALNSRSNQNTNFFEDDGRYLADDTAAAADASATPAADSATTTTVDAAPADASATATPADGSATAAPAAADSGPTTANTDVSNRYTAAFNDLNAKRYRFMVFKHDYSVVPNRVDIYEGEWRWGFQDFANTFDPNQEQVGFIMLGEEGKEKPYMVIFAPGDRSAQQVLDGFGLPSSTQDFQRAGLPDTTNFVAGSRKDLDLNSILSNSKSGLVAIFADDAAPAADASATPADSATTTTVDAAPAAAPADASATTTSTASTSGPTTANTAVDVSDRYRAAFDDLTTKRYKFMIFKHDYSVTPNTIYIEAGPWHWQFLDFANAIVPNQEQVGFMMLGDEGKEKPYMVIFAPGDTPAKQVLDGFGLPYNTQDFQRAGLADSTNYVARTKKELDLNSILSNSKSGLVAIFADDAAPAGDAASAGDAAPAGDAALAGDAAPAADAAAAPAADGSASPAASSFESAYRAAFNDLTNKRFRFVILKRDPVIANKVNLEAGPWNWKFIDFSNALYATEQQVGFILLGEEGKEKPYMVVYAPGGAPVKDVLDLFDLPYTTDDIQRLGLPGANYFVANTKKQLDEASVVGQSQAGTLVQSNTLILAANINNVYNRTIQDLVRGNSRFVVFKHDTKDPWKINLVVGDSKSIFSDFAAVFDAGKEQVGIMYLGQGASQRPYLVVLAPGYRTASQVLDGFELPTNSSDYEKLGLKQLNYYVVSDKKQLDLTNVVMKAKTGGRIGFYQFEEGQWEPQEAEEFGGEFDEPSILATSDKNPYANILKALNEKQYRFAVLRADPANPMNVKVAAAPWAWTFNDFVANINPTQEQVGFITLGPKGGEKPYLIVFVPTDTTSASDVLSHFSVPSSTEDLQKAGLSGASYYVARKLTDLNLDTIVMQSKAGSVGVLLDQEEESDAPEDQQSQEGQEDQQEHSDQEKSDQEQSDEGSGDYNEDGTSGDATEDDTTAITAVDDSTTSTEDVPVLQALISNPYAGLFNGLNDRKYRFLILKHDPNDPMAVKISGGPWKTTFQDFLNNIDENREQVAFVYLGSPNSEKLYRVVVAPSALNSNAGWVVDGFQLPRDSKGLAQLGLRGVASYVAGSKSELNEQRIITYGKASV